MTTIATNGIEMSGDGKAVNGIIVMSLDTQKVFKLKDGKVIGIAGSGAKAQYLVEHYGTDTEIPASMFEDVDMVVIDGTDQVLVYEGSHIAITLRAPVAIGSGRELALGALLAGQSTRASVAIAAQRDIYTGGKIKTLKARAK